MYIIKRYDFECRKRKFVYKNVLLLYVSRQSKIGTSPSENHPMYIQHALESDKV